MTKVKNSKKRSRPGSLGDLYDVLDEAFPQYRTRLGGLNVYALADKLKLHPQAMYRWFENEFLPQGRAGDLIRLSKGTLSKEALVPFVIK